MALIALSVRNLLLGTLGGLAVADGAIRDGSTLEARLEGANRISGRGRECGGGNGHSANQFL